MYPTYPPMMTGYARRPTGPVYRHQSGNGLGQLGTGYAPPEGPPMMQPPQPGYLPQEPGAYPQPGYNTGPLPPNFNPRPMPNMGFNDGRPGFHGQLPPMMKQGNMGFNDGRPGFQNPGQNPGYGPRLDHPWLERLNGRGWR